MKKKGKKQAEKHEYRSSLIAVNLLHEKVIFHIILVTHFFIVSPSDQSAQCSICTKTAQQLGEKPAKGLNSGILLFSICSFCDRCLRGLQMVEEQPGIDKEFAIYFLTMSFFISFPICII